MQISIIAVGKIKEKYLQEGMSEYEKRLRPYIKLQVLEIPDEKRGARLSAAQESQVKEREGGRILAALDPATYVVALDLTGERWSSVDFARHLQEWEISGRNHITFIIGGDLGLSGSILARCHMRLSLSPMTFTHRMARLILLEQVYRAFRILRGEPYHK